MPDFTPQASRRRFFAGATTVGAAAVAATVLPGIPAPGPAAVQVPPAPPLKGGGYWVSDHVRRYYRSTQL